MSNASRNSGRTVLAFILMLLTPLTFSNSQTDPGFVENGACAAKGEDDPQCRPELDAICTYGGSANYDHYLEN